MSTLSMRPLLLVFLAHLSLAAAVPAPDDPPAATEAAQEVAEEPPVEDRPIEGYRRELLEVAIDVASSFPVDPHVKNRSRAQEWVVEACLRLEQPILGLSYVTKIANWRRGAALADLAHYCAERGAVAEAGRYLQMAREVAEGDEEGFKQEWRRDRIRAKIARTLYLLGEREEAAGFSAGLSTSEVGIVEAALAKEVGEEELDDRLAEMDGLLDGLVNADLDLIRAMLASVAQLYERFYADPERRERLEATIERIPRDMVPWAVQIEFEADLARRVLAHGDQEKALSWVLKAREAKSAVHWLPEEGIRIDAELARLRFEAGDTVRARRDLDTALAAFDAQREKIQSMYRAGALRPIAEAYHAMGDDAQALTIYRNAVEEGAVNPNSYPRINDMTKTCVSMAVHGVEPDERLWKRIRAIEAEILEMW